VAQLTQALEVLGRPVTVEPDAPPPVAALHLTRILVALAEQHAIAAERAAGADAGAEPADVEVVSYQATYDKATTPVALELLMVAYWRAQRLTAGVEALRADLTHTDEQRHTGDDVWASLARCVGTDADAEAVGLRILAKLLFGLHRVAKKLLASNRLAGLEGLRRAQIQVVGVPAQGQQVPKLLLLMRGHRKLLPGVGGPLVVGSDCGEPVPEPLRIDLPVRGSRHRRALGFAQPLNLCHVHLLGRLGSGRGP